MHVLPSYIYSALPEHNLTWEVSVFRRSFLTEVWRGQVQESRQTPPPPRRYEYREETVHQCDAICLWTDEGQSLVDLENRRVIRVQYVILHDLPSYGRFSVWGWQCSVGGYHRSTLCSVSKSCLHWYEDFFRVMSNTSMLVRYIWGRSGVHAHIWKFSAVCYAC